MFIFLKKHHVLGFAILLLFTTPIYSQDSSQNSRNQKIIFETDNNNYRLYPLNKKRIRFVATANIVGYSAALLGFNAVWYAQYPRSKFHFFNDNAEWLQTDKAGHVYGSYIESRASNEMWRWSGLPRKKRIWISGLSGVAYQTIIETLDGFSAEYGWSWGDFSANIIGASLFTSQELAWNDQRIKLKFSFHKKNYGGPDLTARANKIFGKSELERLIKDYNASTNWISINIKPFVPDSKLPAWLGVSFGYGAEGMFGARTNVAKDKNGIITFNRSDISRYRQWYISPDIDLTKIKTKKKSLRFLFTVLSAFKFPTSSVEFSRRGVKWHWIYF